MHNRGQVVAHILTSTDRTHTDGASESHRGGVEVWFVASMFLLVGIGIGVYGSRRWMPPLASKHEAVRDNGSVRIVEADPSKADEAEFIMLHEGQIHFAGNLAEFRKSIDPYLKKFLS